MKLRVLISSVVGVVLFVACSVHAYSMRGYHAMGGEMFMLAIPVLVEIAHAMVEQHRDDRERR